MRSSDRSKEHPGPRAGSDAYQAGTRVVTGTLTIKAGRYFPVPDPNTAKPAYSEAGRSQVVPVASATL